MYSPVIPEMHTISLRRLAWATGRPMTKTAAALIENVLSFVDPASVCAKCLDPSKCSGCFFSGALVDEKNGSNNGPEMFDPLKFQIEITEDLHMRPKQVSVLISKKVGKNFCSWSVSHGVTAELESDDYYEDAIASLDSSLKAMISQSLPMGPENNGKVALPQRQLPESVATA
jgi:hypothetical protein